MASKHISAFACCIVYFLSVCVVASAQSKDVSVRKQLDSAYARLNAALKRDGLTGLKLLLKAEEDILAPGEFRDQMLEFVKQTISEGGDKSLKKMIAHNIKIRSLSIAKETAVAKVEHAYDEICLDLDGTYGKVGKEHRLQAKVLYLDHWRNIDGTWKLTLTEPKKNATIVDGKPWKPKPVNMNPRP